jgi:hypothetical protein
MNLNALERLARLARSPEPGRASTSAGTAETAQYALTGAEGSALRSSRWKAAAALGHREDGKPPAVAENPDMGGWF